MSAAITRDLHDTVICTCPDHSLFTGRLGYREYDREVLDTDVVRGQAPGASLFTLVVRGEIRADQHPRLAAVGRLVDVLTADVDSVVIVRRDGNREGPVEA